MSVAAARGGRSFAAEPIVEAPGRLPPVWAAQLVACEVDQSVGLPDTATLTFRDPNHELLAATGITIGAELRVSAVTTQANTPTRLFAGEVTALELDLDATGSFTVVRGAAKTHRLTRGRKVRAFRKMTTADIVREVAAGAGLAVGRVDSFPVVHEQIAQANVSDWDFIQHLARECGAWARVDERGRLEFARPRPASEAPASSTSAAANPMVLEHGRNLLELRAALTGAGGADSVEVRGWNIAAKAPLVARASATRSVTAAPGLSPAAAGSALGPAARMTVADTPYRGLAEADAAAASLADSVGAGFAELEAVVEGDPRLRAGSPVALGNVGAAFSGQYTASRARHLLEPRRGYRTTVVVSASADRSLAGLAGLTAPADPSWRGPRLPGLAVAVVTDVHEPGGGQRGWVRLRFPWLDKDYVSDWARTVQWGGQGGGGVFSPEVNDEVLVGFEQGRLDSPYVLGGLYNGVDRPSPHAGPLVDPATGKVNRRSLVSRSGNRLELLDAAGGGSSGVRLASGDERLEVRLDERRGEITLTVFGAGAALAASSVRVSASEVAIDAGAGAIDLRAGAINLRGRSVTVNGQARVAVSGGALAEIKAALVRIN